MKRIVCAGIPRSGSTWLFNVVRLLFEHQNHSVYGAWFGDYDPDVDKSIHVVKVHDPLEVPDVHAVLMSRRDLRDIAASAVLMKWCKSYEEILVFVRNVVAMHEFWAPRADVEIDYEQIIGAAQGTIETVAHVLGLDHDALWIASRLEALEGPTENAPYNRETLLHRGHRRHGGSRYYTSVLDRATVDAIDREFAEWMQRYGYA